MKENKIIYSKLEKFVKKFYTNELIRGLLFFFGLGLLYFIFTFLIEHLLWLGEMARTLLFWSFIIVELILLIRFILYPLSKLFKLSKGISYSQASAIIGDFFPEINDKLLNYIQLDESNINSELVSAAIEQRSLELKPFSFNKAIDFNKNLKYLPLALFPILVLSVFYLTGNSEIVAASINRVIHYDQKFVAPAPFQINILNKNLTVAQDESFILQVNTAGKVIPERMQILIGSESYILDKNQAGNFEYTFNKPYKSVSFSLKANEVSLDNQILSVVSKPQVQQIKLIINYPSYLGKKNEIIEGSGNVEVPMGTQITWNVISNYTDNILFKTDNSEINLFKTDNSFKISKNITQNTDYQLITSNNRLKNADVLSYSIKVINDAHPNIAVDKIVSKEVTDQVYYHVKMSDDYGISAAQIVYFDQNQPQTLYKKGISVGKTTQEQFVFAFPEGLQLKENINYAYYFQVFDNDAISGYKSAKSAVFNHTELSEVKKIDEQLKQQQSNLNSIQKSILSKDRDLTTLDKIDKAAKEKNELNYKDLKKVNEFLESQQLQDQKLAELSKKIKDNLNKNKENQSDLDKKELVKRLEEAEKKAKEQEKLLKELQNLTDKISKEELLDKLSKIKQDSKSQNKSLEQLVELTKRFYVEKKAEQIAYKSEELAKKQDKLSEQAAPDPSKQADINTSFDQIKEDLKELDKQNSDLKSPMEVPDLESEAKKATQELEDALDSSKKNDQKSAKKSQKNASDAMKKMSSKMSQGMNMDEMDQLEEDIKVLRQILDNLLAFSFKQEQNMKSFKKNGNQSFHFNSLLKQQQNLKNQFKHIDDSLYTLASRNIKIAEKVTTVVGEVHYNMDQSVSNFVENNLNKGISHQQFAVNSSNILADLLSESLQNMQNQMQMQMQMSGQGKGKMPMPSPGDMQLSDIIQKQQGLGKKMDGDKPGKNSKSPGKDGENGKDSGNKPGKSGGNSGNNGDNPGAEGEAGDILSIYKEQKSLREALEKALKEAGNGGNGQNAVDKMKQIERQLLNNGLTERVKGEVKILNQELLKLETALKQQGDDDKRAAQTNKNEFSSGKNVLPKDVQSYINTIEILKKDALPLQLTYKNKVQEYFKNND